MIGTLVNTENMNMFLPAIGKDSIGKRDLIVGVIDEETDTACGVLWAQVREDDEDSLIIREFIVEKSYKDKGAAEELLAFFLDIASDISARNISYSYIQSEDNEYLYELFENAGFADVSEELSEYAVKVVDFYSGDDRTEDPGMRMLSIAELPGKIKSQMATIDMDNCLGDISFIALKDKKVVGQIIFERFRDMIRLRFYEGYGKDKVRVLYLLFVKAIAKIKAVYGPEMWMIISPGTDIAMEQLIKYTDGDAIRYSEAVFFNVRL